MKPSLSLPLYSKVCLINGALFVAAAMVLVISPATVSSQVTGNEVVVLTLGLVVILAANALLLRGVLAPLDRLVQRMDGFSTGTPGERLPHRGDPVAASLARSFNSLLDRLETERAEGNARALAAQENERRRLAQELHDEVGQSLTVVLLGITRALDTGPAEAEQELALVRDSARSSLDEVRRIVRGLRPGVLDDLGLITALRAMADEFADHSGADVRQHLPQQLPAMPSSTELVIFRVAQEALTNVSRHAAASTVDVRLLTDGSTVTLSVVDDGDGIDRPVKGEGIRGMRERAFAVGGELRILPAAAGGTEVSLRVPVAARMR